MAASGMRLCRPVRPARCVRQRCLSKETPLVLRIGESTLELPFSTEEARTLGRSFNALLQTFRDKQESEKPRKWELLKYSYRSEESSADDVTALDVVCNPNAFPSAFDAKLLISLESRSGIKVTGEAELSQLKSDLQTFISTHITKKD